jgi:hypothetical protein
MNTPYGGEYWEIWRETAGNDWQSVSARTGETDQEIFLNHLELATETEFYNSIHPDDFIAFWTDYIDAMVSGVMDRDQFFEEWDIDPADFDWAAWREAMGY